MKIDDILDERGKKYGSYLEQTKIREQLTRVMDGALRDRKKTMESDQNDALIMIAVKISRIVNGDPNYPDNWRDIAGYATLVADRLEGKSR